MRVRGPLGDRVVRGDRRATHPGSGRLRRVLVVDDQTPLRLVLSRGLVRRGFQVFLASSGADALAQLASGGTMDAVVCDTAMPTMTGIVLAGKILRRYPGITVLFISGRLAPPALLANPLIGMILKPVRVADVCDRLDQLIYLAGAHRRRATAAAGRRLTAPMLAPPTGEH